MPAAPWDPLKNLLSLQERMNRLFDETLQKGRVVEPGAGGGWSPAVDIYETDAEIVLVVELPGMRPEDVDIQLRGNTLNLRGERRMEKSVGHEVFQRLERSYGTFSRSFTLPSSADQDKISANFSKGLLEIRMPKVTMEKPHQIKIQTKE